MSGSAVGSVIENIGKVILDKAAVIELVVTALLARGHVLLEDVPGTGKTMLARALAKTVGLPTNRLQCTADLLPSDITGVPIFNQKTGEFEFQEGPVFTSILLADEVNRATPRAQSALLEAMEERQVSVSGHTYALPAQFLVLATQNPVDMAGTYPLPEAQLDRFLIRVSLGYPSAESMVQVLRGQQLAHPIEALKAVAGLADLEQLQAQVREMPAVDAVLSYMVALAEATRAHAAVQLGVSPRGILALHRACQANAVVRGRRAITPDIVQAMVRPVFAHRMCLRPAAQAKGATADKVLSEILAAVRVPV